jgi:hypothetical protein
MIIHETIYWPFRLAALSFRSLVTPVIEFHTFLQNDDVVLNFFVHEWKNLLNINVESTRQYDEHCRAMET